MKQCLASGAVSASVLQSRSGTGLPRSSFHEYCCGLDSLLGQQADQSGYRLRRWGLHNADLYSKAGVDRVRESILRDLASGMRVVLWISLPCDPWCTWNRVFKGRAEYMNELNKRRRESAKAVQLLLSMLLSIKSSKELGNSGKLVCAFERPRNNDGGAFRR